MEYAAEQSAASTQNDSKGCPFAEVGSGWHISQPIEAPAMLMKAMRQTLARNRRTRSIGVATTLQLLNVLVLYDSAASGTSAMNIYQRLINNFGEGYFFSLKLWRFDMLDIRESSLLASRDLAEADMVIVAWSGAAATLSSHRAWVQQWPVVGLGSRRVLVSLFTGPRVEAAKNAFSPEHEFFHGLAKRTGMDLICSPAARADRYSMSAVTPSLPSQDSRRLKKCRTQDKKW